MSTERHASSVHSKFVIIQNLTQPTHSSTGGQAVRVYFVGFHVCEMVDSKKTGLVYSGRRQWQPTPVFFPGKSHGRRSLVGCSPWGHLESDTTERLYFHFSLPCIGEGNVNPLQCSCLENPRDRGAWWAAVHGVAQSRTQLKRLSSSSSSLYSDKK